MPAVYSRLSALHTGIGRKDFLPNVSVVLNQKMSYKLVILLPNSCFVTRFVVSLCIFCLLIVNNSKVCLNKQITMLSIQQFSHTLSVVQIYQYGYIYRCVMENLVSFAIHPVITWNVICSECYRFTLVLGLVLFLCSA